MGPTASGKTELAERLADRLDAVLINADAFQVYRGLDIGTAKPLDKHRYLLLDICDPQESFGVGEWVMLANRALHTAFQENRNALIVGGTGLYIRALFEEWSEMQSHPDSDLRASLEELLSREGIDALLRQLDTLAPDAAKQVDRSNPVRVRRALERAMAPREPIRFKIPNFRSVKFGITIDPATLEERIRSRTEGMLRNGWIEEVRNLVSQGIRREFPSMRAIGYGTVLDLIEGQIGLGEALEGIVRATRQYAKRQRTWLRSEPRLISISSDGFEEAVSSVGFLTEFVDGSKKNKRE